MVKGRGRATRPCLAVGVAIICILAVSEPALGAIYAVGGAGGWTFNVKSWPAGKSFKAGDVLGNPFYTHSPYFSYFCSFIRFSTSLKNLDC